jgi:sigma-B regulation protein RsbQ
MMRPIIPLATSSVERRALKRRAGDGERKIVNSFRHDGRTLRYTLEGAGQALLFVHGLGGRAENWLLQRAVFAPVRRVIAIDLPGHGRSEGRDVSFDRYWEAIYALCDHLHIERIAICGLSLGARAALMLAARHPELVERIVVVNAFVHLKPADQQERLDLYDLLLKPDEDRAWAVQLLHAMGVARYSAIVQGFLQSLNSIDPQHIRARFREVVAFDQRAELADVRCPVLLVRGERDAFVPDYCAAELRRRLRHPRLF